jgi:hypothetical protein
MSDPIYHGYNEDDTKWDDHHRKNGMMTNREFFSSNAKGGFYEGMVWDGDEWVLNAKEQAREDARQRELDKCGWCGNDNCTC